MGAGVIRLAERRDLGWLLQSLQAMHAEAPNLRDRPFAPERASAVLAHLVEAGTAVVAEAEMGALAGFMLFLVTTEGDWWSEPRSIASELALFILPEWRGRMLANRLLGAAEARALYLGVAEIRSGSSVGTAIEATCVVYARAGFADNGRCFRKILDPARVDRTV